MKRSCLSSAACHIDTAIWMHYMDANKTYCEKNLDGNYTRMLRAILNKSCAATPHKTPPVRPPTLYHENYP